MDYCYKKYGNKIQIMHQPAMANLCNHYLPSQLGTIRILLKYTAGDVAVQIMPNFQLIIIYHNSWVQYSTNKIYKILSVLWQQNCKVNICSKSQSRDKILYILIFFVFYPAIMVDNDQIEIRHDLYSYISSFIFQYYLT